MGRSVSQPKNTTEACFFDISWMYEDEDGNLEPDDFTTQRNYENFCEMLINDLQNRYPSLYNVSRDRKWLGRENKVLLENHHAYIGISTYGAVACVWLVCRYEYDDVLYPDDNPGLSQSWCTAISEGFREVVRPTLSHLGRFGNGIAVFQRVDYSRSTEGVE